MAEGPDLSAAREALEALMEDTCTILPPPDLTDDTLDPDTLALADPGPAPVQIYGPETEPYLGKCMVRITGGLGVGDHTIERGGGYPERRNYSLGLPVDAPEVPVGALVRIETSRRDPLLPGTEFVAGKSVRGTLIASRRVALELR